MPFILKLKEGGLPLCDETDFVEENGDLKKPEAVATLLAKRWIA